MICSYYSCTDKNLNPHFKDANIKKNLVLKNWAYITWKKSHIWRTFNI